jgi:acetyl-CoA synthetase
MSNDYSLQLQNQISGIRQIGEKLDAFGKLHGLNQNVIFAANLAIEELFINIISHACEDGKQHAIDIGFSLTDKKLALTLEDDGKEFNPTVISGPPVEKISLENIEDAELGLRMVRSLADAVTYERRRGRNVVRLMIEDTPEKRGIASVMQESRVFPPPETFLENARIKTTDAYQEMYRRSIADPEAFWARQAEELDWVQRWDKTLVENFSKGVHRWFIGGKLNLATNCLDRHLSTWRKNKAAVIWEGDAPGEEKMLTYQQLHRQVCRFANVLKKRGVRKGDRVVIYLSMTVELSIAVLACARIGAVHAVVFAGLKASALKDRMLDSGARLLICASSYTQGGVTVNCKKEADLALSSCPDVAGVIVTRRLKMEASMRAGRDFCWDEEIEAADISGDCPPEIMDAEDPLFIHYTRPNGEKPMGVLHTTAGYLVYVMQTFKWVFDIRDTDTFWCTADIAWHLGQSYSIYGPLVNGATSVLFEGAADYPHPDRFWNVIEKYGVSIFYTSAIALRSVMKSGNFWPARRDLRSLRLLGLTGASTRPKVWTWYHDIIGHRNCPVVDTWWRAETGGIVFSAFPGAAPCKPGATALPFFGIQPEIVASDPDQTTSGQTPPGNGGCLVIKKPWPGLMRKVYGDPGKFKKTCFTRFPGVYTTGETARMDDDGCFWIMGGNDDAIDAPAYGWKSAEPEDATAFHDPVTDASVAAGPDESKAPRNIHTVLTLKTDILRRDDLIAALRNPQRARTLYHQDEPQVPTFTYQA